MSRERLRTELDRLRADGVLDEEQCRRVDERLATALFPVTDRIGTLTAIIATFGALLLGTGVLFVVAGNWDDIPKWWKLGLIVGTFMTMHHFGFTLAERPGNYPRVGRALTAAGVLAYGAVIALVAQIYGLESKYPWALLVWGALNVPIALLTRSGWIATIVLVLLGIWATAHTVVWLGALPGEISWRVEWLVIPCMWLVLGVVFKLAHVLAMRSRFHELEQPARLLATPLVILWIYALSFRHVAEDLPRFEVYGWTPYVPLAIGDRDRPRAVRGGVGARRRAPRMRRRAAPLARRGASDRRRQDDALGVLPTVERRAAGRPVGVDRARRATRRRVVRELGRARLRRRVVHEVLRVLPREAARRRVLRARDRADRRSARPREGAQTTARAGT
jgi:hypothetical protein